VFQRPMNLQIALTGAAAILGVLADAAVMAWQIRKAHAV